MADLNSNLPAGEDSSEDEQVSSMPHFDGDEEFGDNDTPTLRNPSFDEIEAMINAAIDLMDDHCYAFAAIDITATAAAAHPDVEVDHRFTLLMLDGIMERRSAYYSTQTQRYRLKNWRGK